MRPIRLNSGASTPPATSVAAADATLTLARLLLACGADVAHAHARTASFASSLDAQVQFAVMPEAVLAAAAGPDGRIVRIAGELPAAGVDMSKLGAIDELMRRSVQAASEPATFADELRRIESAPSLRPGWLVTLGMATTAACLARLFGAAAAAVAAAFVAGVAVMVVHRFLAARRVGAVAASFLAALAGGVAAVLVSAAIGSSPMLALTAAGMILVPGVPLINGIRDISTGHAGSAVARLGLSCAVVLAVSCALFCSAYLLPGALPWRDGPGSVGLAEDVVLSALAAVGYATMFQVPARALWPCVVCGAIGHPARDLLIASGLDLAGASAAAAFAVGLVARGCGALFAVPPVTFAFPGVVSMMPGSYAFRAGIAGLSLQAAGVDASPSVAAATFALAALAAVVTIAIGMGLVLALAGGSTPALPHHSSAGEPS